LVRLQNVLLRKVRDLMTPIETTVSFDMRSPSFGAPTQHLYAAALEMAAYADRIGVDRIGLMEHHGSDDGYLPQHLCWREASRRSRRMSASSLARSSCRYTIP
jgi:hypothetical protein